MALDLAEYHSWLSLLHVLAVMAFLLTHGLSGLIALKVRGERDRARIQTMVQLSSSFLVWGWLALAVLFVAGIAAGIAGGWWTSGRLWIWASLAVFLGVTILMTPVASSYMEGVRHAVGLPSDRGSAPQATGARACQRRGPGTHPCVPQAHLGSADRRGGHRGADVADDVQAVLTPQPDVAERQPPASSG